MAQTPEVAKMYEDLDILLEAGETAKAKKLVDEIGVIEKAEYEAELSPEEVLIEEIKTVAPDAVVTETAIDEPTKEATPVAKKSAQIKLDDISEEPVVEAAVPSIKKGATVSITKDQLGITAFESVLDVLISEDIAALFTQVADTENLTALTLENTVVDAEHRIHVKSSGDVSRAARGAAIAVAGGVANGLVTSPSGNKHEIRDGLCISMQRQNQINGDGSITPLYAESACKGHLKYRKDFTTGQFVRVEGEHLRCKHAWAAMYAAGYFVTFATNPHKERAAFEIANSVGDEQARIDAKQVEAGWESNRQDKFEMRKTYAVAKNAAVNAGLVEADGTLPAFAGIADYTLPSGETVAQAVSALKGQRFVLRIEVPVGDERRESSTRVVNNMTELAKVIAPSIQVCKMDNVGLKVLEVVAR